MWVAIRALRLGYHRSFLHKSWIRFRLTETDGILAVDVCPEGTLVSQEKKGPGYHLRWWEHEAADELLEDCEPLRIIKAHGPPPHQVTYMIDEETGRIATGV